MRVEKIGDATLYLGDCQDILPILGNVDAVVTDPPYGMSFVSNHRKAGYRPIANDGSEDLLKFACDIQVNHSKYIFCRYDNIYSLPKPKNVVAWVKNNWSMGDLQHEHARQTEICLFYTGTNHFFPNGRPSDIINFPRTGNIHHPTEKPVGLMEWVINNTSGRVIDPFMGSGTTGVACAKLGHSFIGIELDEEYFDIACRRIEDAYKQADMFIAPPKEPEAEQSNFL